MSSRSRAIALVVALAVLGATGFVLLGERLKADRNAAQQTAVIVSSQDIPPNTELNPLISAGVFRTVMVPNDTLVEGAVTDTDELAEQTTSALIFADEQIPTSRLGGVCGLPTSAFIAIRGNTYIRDPGRSVTLVPPDLSARLPDQATETHIRIGDASVWRETVQPGRVPTSVFVKFPDHVERWPQYACEGL